MGLLEADGHLAEELCVTIGVELDREPFLVHGPVMPTAQKHQVVELRGAAAGPVNGVMRVAVTGAIAGETTVTVSGRESAGEVVRLLRPTSSTPPSGAWRMTTVAASHARRRDVSAETYDPSSNTDCPVLLPPSSTPSTSASTYTTTL